MNDIKVKIVDIICNTPRNKPANSKCWQACNKHELETWLVLATSVGGLAVVTVVDKSANITETGSVA